MLRVFALWCHRSVNKIMLDLKSMGFEMDFPVMKLKQAAGEHVCRVLLFLADHVRFRVCGLWCLGNVL